LCGEAVSGGVVGGKRAQPGIDLDGGDLDAGDTRQQTKPGDANTGADIEHALAGLCRHGSGEKHGIATGTMAGPWLNDAEAPAEKIVGRGAARRRRPRPRFFYRRQ
jgi:hypothetical protein